MGVISGQPICIGIQFSTTTGKSVNNNVIDVTMDGQDAALIAFTPQDHGYNVINVVSYSTAGASISGTPNVNNDLVVRGSGSAPNVYINTKRQLGSMTIPANSASVWTYPHAFNTTPNVQFSHYNPPLPLTAPLWINGNGPTSVSIYNPNTTSVTEHMTAEAPF